MHTTTRKILTKNWGCKCKYVIKNTLRKWHRIGTTFLSMLGIMLTIAECILWMFKSDIIYVWMHEYVLFIIGIFLLVSFFVNKVTLKYEYSLKGSDIKLTLQVMDVLDNRGAIVIPTNTTFDTLMEDEFISVNSVQGQFQKKFFEHNLHTLDDLIEMGLQDIDYEIVNRGGSKKKRYPLGTISKVSFNGVHYYFVAIADINQYGKPINTSFQNIQIALEGLWNQLEIRGHIENLAIPLLGTGKAGIKDATREKVIKEIIFSFIASSQERKITEKLLICVHPFDLEQKDLNLSELDEYLRYMCKYRYMGTDNRAEGIAI